MMLDLRLNRISNRYLLVIWGIGFGMRIVERGAEGFLLGTILSLLPVIVLYFLYQMRALGAGDVKLFAAVGVYLSIELLIQWIAFSFLCGALIALWVLLKKQIFRQRLMYLSQYVKDQILLFPHHRIYQNAYIGQENVIHFTIPMFVGFCILVMIG